MPELDLIAQAIALAVASFASEDLALVTAALLIHDGRLGLWTGLAGVGGGILVGDVALWLAGRLVVERVLRLRFVAARVSPNALEQAKRALETRLPAAVLTSRFLPGSRLPLHLAAGALGRGGWRYAFWTTVAVAVWVPLVVGIIAVAGGGAADSLRAWLGSAWVATAALALLSLVLLRFTGKLRFAPIGGDR